MKLNEQTAMSAQLMNQNNAQSLFTPYIIMCGNTDITSKWYQSKDTRHLWNKLKMKPEFLKFSGFLFIFHIYYYFTKEGHCSSNVKFRKRFYEKKWRKTQTKSSFTRIREIWANILLFFISTRILVGILFVQSIFALKYFYGAWYCYQNISSPSFYILFCDRNTNIFIQFYQH